MLQALLQDPFSARNLANIDDWQDVSVKRRSIVWQHFDYSKSREASRCRFCFKILKNGGGSTKCLINHLTSKHKIEIPKTVKVEHIKVESIPCPDTSFPENRPVENIQNVNVTEDNNVTVMENSLGTYL